MAMWIMQLLLSSAIINGLNGSGDSNNGRRFAKAVPFDKMSIAVPSSTNRQQLAQSLLSTSGSEGTKKKGKAQSLLDGEAGGGSKKGKAQSLLMNTTTGEGKPKKVDSLLAKYVNPADVVEQNETLQGGVQLKTKHNSVYERTADNEVAHMNRHGKLTKKEKAKSLLFGNADIDTKPKKVDSLLANYVNAEEIAEQNETLEGGVQLKTKKNSMWERTPDNRVVHLNRNGQMAIIDEADDEEEVASSGNAIVPYKHGFAEDGAEWNKVAADGYRYVGNKFVDLTTPVVEHSLPLIAKAGAAAVRIARDPQTLENAKRTASSIAPYVRDGLIATAQTFENVVTDPRTISAAKSTANFIGSTTGSIIKSMAKEGARLIESKKGE